MGRHRRHGVDRRPAVAGLAAERGAAELRARAWPCATGVPPLARVTDPLRQVRQQLQGGPGQSEFAFLLGAATQHLAFATGEVAGLRYADGALDVEMAPGARRDPAPEGARRTGSRRRPRTAYPSSRRLAPAPRAAAAAPASRSRASRSGLAAAPFAAGRKRIADWRARAGNYWLGLAPRERAHAGRLRLAGAGRAVLAVADRAGAGQGRARARRTDAPARLEHRAGNIAGQRASRANRARPGDGSVAAPRPGAGRLAGRRDGARPGWPLAPEPGGRAGRTLAALAADAAWASVAAAGPDRLAPHRCARRRVQAGRHGAGSTG